MTLHEQFLQRYRALGKGSAKSTRRAYTQNICKQSYLNSIDCMLAMIIGATSEEGHYLGKHLKEQRELIANEN